MTTVLPMRNKRAKKQVERVISLRIPGDLDDKVNEAAKTTRIRKADVLRMAVDRGVDRLLEQLKTESVA